MLKLSFHQTDSEQMVRVAATLLFNALIRSGTQLVKLSSLTEKPQYGFTASATDQPVGPKFVRITDLKDGQINWETVPYCECEQVESYKLAKGDILFARTGATTGKTHLVLLDHEAVFASYLIRLRTKPYIVLPEYLYSFFQSNSYWEQIVDEKQGSAQPNVNGQKLLEIELPLTTSEVQASISNFLSVVRNRANGFWEELPELPPPLEEQRRIVARIEALASRVAEAQRLRMEAIREVEAILTSAKHELFSRESLNHYQRFTLGEIADVRSGVTLGRNLVGSVIRLPYLRVANVQDGYLDLDEIKEVEVKANEFSKWQLEAGDMLLTEGGDWDKLGRGSVWQNEIQNCIHQNHIFRLRFDQSKFDPYYLMELISSPYGKSYFQSSSKQTTNLASINQRQLKAFEVFQPPLQEQKQIVHYLNNLRGKTQTIQRLQSATQTELDALLPAILDKAFRGEL